MKKMTANFYPAPENKPCGGESLYLGKADLTIANAIRINGISVFLNKGEYNINFPEFGEGTSYVVPHSKEAYAAMRDVVAMAVASKNHFGYNKGEYGIHFDVSGNLVQEPYADGRFSASIPDLCTLYGITTRPVEYERADGQMGRFVAVNMPTIYSYEKDGEKQYQTAFEGRISAWTDKAGQEQSINYNQILEGKVRSERKTLIKERKPTLDSQMKDAETRKEGHTENPRGALVAERY